ncbi:NUDIX hydrolase [Bailinhaonella thermotolerans]|uniref:NUDIX hydrolase n=2 Tax=Bailinhaonella thermotolerans TaxID=1070861 RepID=A0A3A4B5X9_9ACTN|nr:NUDIX hydrolase [Bailinhaonella thermotolerans]
MSQAEWFASLPTFYATAALLFTDPGDRVLLVKPNYRDHWNLPGGIMEADEAPHECAVREAAEEIGVTATAGELLVVDWLAAEGDRPRATISYIFDGGVVPGLDGLRLQAEELDDARFWTWEEAEAQMWARTAARIPAARTARDTGRTVYLPAR